MYELWRDYHQSVTARFAGNPGREPDGGGDIIVHDWSITSPLRTPRGDRWYVQGNGYTRRKLMRQTLGGDVEAVRNAESGTRLAAFPDGELLLSQPEICNNYNYYYDLYPLGPGDRLSPLTRSPPFPSAPPPQHRPIPAIHPLPRHAKA